MSFVHVAPAVGSLITGAFCDLLLRHEQAVVLASEAKNHCEVGLRILLRHCKTKKTAAPAAQISDEDQRLILWLIARPAALSSDSFYYPSARLVTF